jgi:ADP-ribosylglycohydrolase
MRAVATTVLLLGVLGSFVTACGSATADLQSKCDQAVAQAIAIDPGSDTVSAVDGAIAGCQSLEAWVAAAEQYPDGFGGQDPASLANERCAASAELASAPVCTDLQGN